MTTLLLVALLATSGYGATTDTTLAVTQGSRLEIENFNGSVRVTGWDRAALRIRATHGSHTRVALESSRGLVAVRSEGRMGPAGEVDYEISAPAWMALKVSGVDNETHVEGIQARISVESVMGGVEVRGGADRVHVESVQGGVKVSETRGRVEASSVNASVVVSDVEGDIEAEAVNGPVTLERVRSSHVEGSSVNSSVDFEGALTDGGQYHFSSHNGPVHVCLPEGSNVSVRVSQVGGEFRSDFPVTTRGMSDDKDFEFTLGSGRAELELESFQGGIVLCRQGAGSPRRLETPKERRKDERDVRRVRRNTEE